MKFRRTREAIRKPPADSTNDDTFINFRLNPSLILVWNCCHAHLVCPMVLLSPMWLTLWLRSCLHRHWCATGCRSSYHRSSLWELTASPPRGYSAQHGRFVVGSWRFAWVPTSQALWPRTGPSPSSGSSVADISPRHCSLNAHVSVSFCLWRRDNSSHTTVLGLCTVWSSAVPQHQLIAAATFQLSAARRRIVLRSDFLHRGHQVLFRLSLDLA